MPGKKPTYSQLEKRILELENKLQKKEEKFRWLFQQSPEAITILTLDGVILDFSHEYAFTGYHRDEMIGKHFTELASFKEEEERFKSIVNGNTEPFNIKVITKNGDTLWGEVHPGIFGNKDEKFIRLLVRDVTDELKQEERYENILKTAIDGYWLVNQDGSVLDANQAAADMLGYSLKELSGLNVSDIEAKETAEETKIHIAEIKKQGSGFFETKHRKKDGSIIDIEVSVSFLSTFEGHFVAVIRDITEKKQMQKRLLRKKELLDKSQSMAKLGSWELELEENTLYWSDEVYRIFGIQPQQFKATYEAFLDRVHPDDRKAVSKAYEESLEKNQDQYEIEHRIIRKDSGEIRYVHEKCIHYKDDSGKIFKSVGMVQDITDRKRNESEREITLRLLKHLNTNEGLHELLSGVVQAIKDWSGFEAVGIRIKEGEDYPYFESSGFPADFVEKENTLCEEDKNGKYVRDTQGNPVLECMCGNVLSGRYDSSLPFFTENGSFWTNSTTELLASTSDEDRKTRTRNRCNGEGYESVSLIPLKHGNQTLGLIQINDSRKNLLDKELVYLFERLASKIVLSLIHQYTAEELNQSEKKYRTIVDESPIGILYFNNKGEITDCNKKFVEVIGSSKETLINLNMFTQLKNEKLTNAVKDALETGEGYFEDWYSSVTANKKTFVRILFEGIRNEKDEIVAGLGMVEDITDRKQAEVKLQKQEAKQRTMIANISDVLAIMDEEGIIRYKSPNIEKLFGWKPEELIGKYGWETVHPEDQELLKEKFSSLIKEEGATTRVEYSYKCKNGRYIPVHLTAVNLLDNPAINGVLLNYHDISDRKNREQQIKLNEERLDALVELNEMIYDNLDDVYNFTLEKAIKLTKSEIGFLGFLNEDEAVVTIYDWSESAKDECEIKDNKIKFKVEEAGIWGEVVRQRKPFLINDFKAPNPLKRGLPGGHVEIKNYLSVPVFQGNKIVSLIAVGNKKEDYHQDDLKQLKLLLDGMMKFVIKRESEREIISAKQKAEESEERYQNFLKHSSEGIYRLEMDEPMDTSLGEEEQIDFLYDNAYIAECNEAFVKMYGAASIDNFIGMRLIDMHEGRNHPINRQEVREFVREDYRIEDKQTKEKKVTGEVLYLSNNTIGIEEDGKIVRMWGTQTDITQRKIMQNQLILAKEKSENEESKAKSVLKAIPDLMFLFSHEGNILDYHAEDNSMLYRPPEDFLNKKIDEVLPGYLVTLTHKKIDEVLKTGEMREYDYKMDINQQVFYFEARMVKVANDKALTIVRDVTESRKNKQELVKAKVKAEESDRLKSAFLANMSHEIRTPMNAIMGFSQMLYEKEFPRNRQKKFLDLINTRTKDLLQIINDIVDISKIEANQLTVNFERFNLNDLLHQIYETYRLQNKEAKKQDLHFELKNGLARDKSYLYSDYHRLNQVLENLLSNAFKYTSKGSIALGYEQQSANILQFYVKDTGIGIDPEDQKSIFERFRQVDGSSSRAYEGTGLGLAITKSLVELLGGEIRVDSKPGEGAVFYFTIPYQDAPGEENIDETKIAEGNYNWKGKTILLVEDDPASYEYMKEVIEPAGARLIIKETGKEGLKALADIKTPDLILMDIRLPDISGLEIIRQIRKTNKEIPIIAQTAHAMGEDRQTCLKAGASDYLSKPVALKDLMAIIDRYL